MSKIDAVKAKLNRLVAEKQQLDDKRRSMLDRESHAYHRCQVKAGNIQDEINYLRGIVAAADDKARQDAIRVKLGLAQ